jgi:hypothetical protein
VHHSNFARPLCALFISILLAGSATLHAERFLYSFSGRVTSIEDPSGALARSNYYRTGDVVSASFIVDLALPGYEILNDGSRLVHTRATGPNIFVDYFYCRLVSGPLLPNLGSGWASNPEAARFYLYGADWCDSTGCSTTLFGGSAASFFSIFSARSRNGLIRNWSEGLALSGIASAYTDTEESVARMDLRLDSITPAPDLPPDARPSVPQAINIPGLIESTNDTFFVLTGRTRHISVTLNAPPTDDDGDPLFLEWWALDQAVPPSVIGFLGHGEAPVIQLPSGTQGILLRARDGWSERDREFSVTVYTPAQATAIMRNALRGLPLWSREKTTGSVLLQNAASSFQRSDWKRGVQFLQTFEQFMARSAFTIPRSKRSSCIDLSRAIRRAVAQPL